MAIRTIEDSKKLKKYGAIMGRERIAIRIIELCKQVANEENYIDAVKIAGRIKAIAMACKFDCYWDEKMSDGYYQEIGRAETEIYHDSKTPPPTKRP